MESITVGSSTFGTLHTFFCWFFSNVSTYYLRLQARWVKRGEVEEKSEGGKGDTLVTSAANRARRRGKYLMSRLSEVRNLLQGNKRMSTTLGWIQSRY